MKERELLILREIIDAYVETAVPVGSQTVARRGVVDLSPATVRAVMMDLEEQGYLAQPHTSAGRVPTDRAYRSWVDGWLEPGLIDEAEIERIEKSFDGVPHDLASLLDQAARLLGGACRQVGIAVAPSLGASHLAGIEFVRVAEQRVLILLRIEGGGVRTVLLEVSSRLDSDTLAHTARRLNERLVGLTLEEIRRTLADRVRDGALGEDEIVMRLVALGPGLFRIGETSALYVRGTSELAGQPEFQAPERLRELLRVIEEQNGLGRLLEDRSARPGLEISIGGENPSGPLASTSIVTLTWASGPMAGTVGVVGPTRMPYPRVVALLAGIARQIDRRLIA